MSTADGNVVGTTQILDNGPRGRRWNLVLLGDGYRQADLTQFANDAQAFVNALLATPPFDTVQGINVFRVDVTSTDSGADDPAGCGGAGTAAATYFDAMFCGDGATRRLLTVNTATVLDVVDAQVPEANAILVLVNSAVYGGSGGAVGTMSLHPSANQIGIHELGHTAFGLADDNSDFAGCASGEARANHPGPEPAAPNVTINIDPATIKWATLVTPGTPVPTTTNANCAQCDSQANPVAPGTVGAFEGADTWHCGAFRPQFNCYMRALGQPFCAVCQRRIRAVVPVSLRGVQGIAVAPLPDKRLQAWASDRRGRLHSIWKVGSDSNADWTSWLDFLGEVGELPAPVRSVVVTPLPDGRLELWVTDTNGGLWTTWKISGHADAAWTAPWVDFLAEVGGLPAAAQNLAVGPLPDGRLELWVSDANGGLWTTWKLDADPNAAWAPWVDFLTEVGGLPAGARNVAVGVLPDGRLELWVSDANGGLWTTWKVDADPNAAWAPWVDFLAEVGGLPAGAQSVAVAPLPDKRLEFWVSDANGGLWTTWKVDADPNAAWAPWVDFLAEVGGLPAGAQSVAVAPLPDKRLEFWVSDANGGLWTTWKVAADPNAAWAPWDDFTAL